MYHIYDHSGPLSMTHHNSGAILVQLLPFSVLLLFSFYDQFFSVISEFPEPRAVRPVTCLTYSNTEMAQALIRLSAEEDCEHSTNYFESKVNMKRAPQRVSFDNTIYFTKESFFVFNFTGNLRRAIRRADF